MIDLILLITLVLFLIAYNLKILSLAKADNFDDVVYLVSDNKFINFFIGIVVLTFLLTISYRASSYSHTAKAVVWILLFPMHFYIRFKNYLSTKEDWHLVTFTVFTIVQTVLLYKYL
ncbi:hypothetical protein R9X47_03255 [Wukongibacter baidiensis]|uniref:hypothetical protein n=1 Tax=Wukongibacter baidiensis TaxID=1723361 RepID=UPI003D7F4A09